MTPADYGTAAVAQDDARTSPDGRQVARTLYMPPDMVPYLNWAVIGQQRADLACHMDVVQHSDGGITITLFWL